MRLRYRIAPFYRRVFNLVARRDRGFRAMILHHVAPEETAAFAAILDDVAQRHGFITPDAAERVMRGDASPLPPWGTPWLVTFDDGFASNVDTARDVLAPRGIAAVFFVCPGLVDASRHEQQGFAGEYLFPGGLGKPSGPVPRIMTWDEIRVLRDAGHTIGSHSMMHRRLATLSCADVAKDVDASAERLAAELGEAPRWFAWPFGDVDSISQSGLTAIAQRFELCCSGIRGLNTPDTPRTAIRRDGIDLGAPAEYARLVIDGGLGPLYRSHRRRLGRLVSEIPARSIG